MPTLKELQESRAADEARIQATDAAIAELQAQPVMDTRVCAIVGNAVEALLLPLGDEERAAVLGSLTGKFASVQIANAQDYTDACERLESAWGPAWAERATEVVSKQAIPFLGSAMQDAMLAWQARQSAPAQTLAAAPAVAAVQTTDATKYTPAVKDDWAVLVAGKTAAHMPNGSIVDISGSKSLNAIAKAVEQARGGHPGVGNKNFRQVATGAIEYHTPEGQVRLS